MHSFHIRNWKYKNVNLPRLICIFVMRHSLCWLITSTYSNCTGKRLYSSLISSQGDTVLQVSNKIYTLYEQVIHCVKDWLYLGSLACQSSSYRRAGFWEHQSVIRELTRQTGYPITFLCFSSELSVVKPTKTSRGKKVALQS